MDVYSKIINEEYNSKLQFPTYEYTKNNKLSKEEVREMRKKWREDEYRLKQVFKQDALEELGLSKHEKADKLFEMAWEEGHSNGLGEVWIYMEQFAELIN